MEANRRSEYSSANNSTEASSSDRLRANNHLAQTYALPKDRFDADLTTFFPFDPYKLPRSSVFIEDIYREWASVAIEEDDDDSDDDGDGDADEYEGEDGDVGADAYQGGWAFASAQASSQSQVNGANSGDESGGLGESFGGMSISPSVPRPLLSLNGSL